MKPILVTGAAGLSGAIAVRELARQGAPVRALVRRPTALFDGLSVEVVVGDMTRPGAALQGVQRAFMISSSDEAMVETQCRFVDAARAAGVAHIVKMSGEESGIGFDPAAFRFVRMHEEIEDYLEGSGVSYTHLRPSQFMQVYLRERRGILERRELALPMAGARQSPVDLEDVAKVAARILAGGGHEGMSYRMTGPEALSMSEVAARLSDALGATVRYVDVDPETWKRGLPPERADALAELFAERRRRPESRVDLSTHARFDVRPTTFAEFARRHFGGTP